jgi:hypothetical protein
MRPDPVIAFSLWHAGGMLAASLNLRTRLHVTQAAIGRVTALSPVLRGYLEISRAHRGRRSRWILDIATGDDSRPAIIRAAIGVAVRHATAMVGPTIVIVAGGEVAEAFGDTPLRLFANAAEARRWIDAASRAGVAQLPNGRTTRFPNGRTG